MSAEESQEKAHFSARLMHQMQTILSISLLLLLSFLIIVANVWAPSGSFINVVCLALIKVPHRIKTLASIVPQVHVCWQNASYKCWKWYWKCILALVPTLAFITHSEFSLWKIWSGILYFLLVQLPNNGSLILPMVLVHEIRSYSANFSTIFTLLNNCEFFGSEGDLQAVHNFSTEGFVLPKKVPGPKSCRGWQMLSKVKILKAFFSIRSGNTVCNYM